MEINTKHFKFKLKPSCPTYPFWVQLRKQSPQMFDYLILSHLALAPSPQYLNDYLNLVKEYYDKTVSDTKEGVQGDI